MASNGKRKKPDCGQDAIWTYYQNDYAEYFQTSNPRMEYIIEKIKAKKRHGKIALLNIGVGNGYLEKVAYANGWDVYSIDPDAASVNKLKEIGINAFQGYIDALDFHNNLFDFVVASEVLEHLSKKQLTAGLGEIKRVLRPGGWFIGTVPFRENLDLNNVFCPHCRQVFHRWGHKRTFDLESIHRTLGLFFNNIRARRTAFVSFKNRGIFGMLKSIVRILLAKLGAEIAVPSIFFMAGKNEK